MWFKYYLENRKQCVGILNITSEYLDFNIGVPHGSILGPLLFSMIANDSANVCPPDVICQIYADDDVMYSMCMHKKKSATGCTEIDFCDESDFTMAY